MAGESVIRLSVINDASPKLRAVDRDAKKLNKTVKNSGGVLNQQNRSLKNVALSWLGVGKGAKAATPGIATAGVAMNTALAAILPFIAAGTLLAKVFGTLAQQDFAEAKFSTLGGNSEELTQRLKLLSSELQGQASVTELTAAAYDVASAGFTNAADAAMILKAASLGATGGFTDINTAGGAAVKVLNAYGLGAEDAAFLMDQFAQTQADGIITIGEYSRNIGKVATTAAALGVPLKEVNAIIAQSTAAGTQTETAFSGLNAALAKLSSGEIGKRLGADIDATTLASEGLAGTLEKLQQFSTAELQQAFGIEAFKGLQVAIKDLDKFNELLANQEEAQGAAARAAFTASDTIQKQLERLGKAFTNIFADGSEMGEFLKITLYGINGVVELLGVAIKTLVFPFRLLIDLAKGFFEGLGIQAGPSGPIQKLTEGWFVFLKAVDVGFQKVRDFTVKLGEGVGKIAKTIVDPFVTAFNFILKKVREFWDALPGWVQWGIKQVTGYSGAVAMIEGIKAFATPEAADPLSPEADKNKKEKDSTDELRKQVELTKFLDEGFKKVGETISHSLKDGIKGLIKGTQTLGEMLSNIAMKVSDMLLDLAISGIFKKWGLPGFASGGIPPVGKPAIVGEEGPELFVPRQAGRIIPNDKLGGGGGSVNVSVHVDASGSSVEGDENEAAQLGNMLGAAIQAELIRQQRPGGLLAA